MFLRHAPQSPMINHRRSLWKIDATVFSRLSRDLLDRKWERRKRQRGVKPVEIHDRTMPAGRLGEQSSVNHDGTQSRIGIYALITYFTSPLQKPTDV